MADLDKCGIGNEGLKYLTKANFPELKVLGLSNFVHIQITIALVLMDVCLFRMVVGSFKGFRQLFLLRIMFSLFAL